VYGKIHPPSGTHEIETTARLLAILLDSGPAVINENQERFENTGKAACVSTDIACVTDAEDYYATAPRQDHRGHCAGRSACCERPNARVSLCGGCLVMASQNVTHGHD
jgi:hypothetical protein